MTDNEMLAFMGTDPVRWVAQFQVARGRRLAEDGVDIANDDATMVGWFANALEAGRRAAEFAAVIDEARQRYDSDDRSAVTDNDPDTPPNWRLLRSWLAPQQSVDRFADVVLAKMDRLEQIAPTRMREWPHYWSTYCIHQLHQDCRQTCKTCQSPCRCPCHTQAVELPPLALEVLEQEAWASRRLDGETIVIGIPDQQDSRQ